MQQRFLGKTGLSVSVLGFGAFKIGRNRQHRYSRDYPLPSEREASRLLNEALDAGVTLVDTAPAYEFSEERIGRSIGHRRAEFVLATKVGEEFTDSKSKFDFSRGAVRRSVERSLSRLRTDVLDIVLVHSPEDDLHMQRDTDVIPTLQELRSRGLVRTVGFSGKTVAGNRLALEWADVLMVACHAEDRSQDDVMAEAGRRGVGVLVKKGLDSGRIPPSAGLGFLLAHESVSSILVGTCNAKHLRDNVKVVNALTGE